MIKNDNDFISIAKKVIEKISLEVELIDAEYSLEIDFLDDVLTIDSLEGRFVVNYNVPLKQIWLSSPISGPHHFSCINNEWLNKDHEELHLLLNKETLMILKS